MYSPLIAIFITVFIDLIGFGIIVPLLPLYAETFGVGGLEIGLLFSVFSLTRLIFSPIIGGLSDKVGRRPLLVFTILTSGLAHLLFALSGSLIMLFAARALAGLGASNISVASAYIADSTDPKHRTQGMGVISAGYNLGFIFGPALGGVLSIYGYATPILVASAMSLSAGVFAILFLHESLLRENRQPKFALSFKPRNYFSQVSSYRIGLFFIVQFLVSSTVTNLTVTLPLFSARRFGLGGFEVGLLFMLTGIFGGLAQGILVGRLSQIISEAKILASGLTTAASGFILMRFSSDFLALSVALSIISTGLFMGYPIVKSMVSKAVPPDKQGSILGLTEATGSMGTIIGPVLAGIILDKIGVETPFIWGSITMLIGVLVSLKISRSISTTTHDHQTFSR